MSKRTDERLNDVGIWWEHNVYSGPRAEDGKLKRQLPESLDKRVELLADGFESLVFLMSSIIEDIQVLEGRGPALRNVSDIWTPDNQLKK
jgi:hypothetical protein